METYIFGAKATAAGLYKALSVLEPETVIRAFLVSKPEENVPEIWGCPVRGLDAVADELSEDEKSVTPVYVAVPELVHDSVREVLESYGFRNLILLDSRMEADLMGRYCEAVGRFRSVHSLKTMPESRGDDVGKIGLEVPKITVYAASFYKDKPLTNPPVFPDYVKKLYLGCEGAVQAGIDISQLAGEGQDGTGASGGIFFCDNTGDNISGKNPNRCEMTAHYWVWKNRLDTDDEYVGICHYRRMLDLSEEDLRKIQANDVDVVLPYPMLHYPSARIQHTWYVPEKDWELMRRVVAELYPAYGERFEEIFDAPEFYNYNMLLAKKSVFAEYCDWLYPILDRIEELSEPRGCDRHDRYTAYMSESLETLYFMANLNRLKIYHTGRLLYT